MMNVCILYCTKEEEEEEEEGQWIQKEGILMFDVWCFYLITLDYHFVFKRASKYV